MALPIAHGVLPEKMTSQLYFPIFQWIEVRDSNAYIRAFGNCRNYRVITILLLNISKNFKLITVKVKTIPKKSFKAKIFVVYSDFLSTEKLLFIIIELKSIKPKKFSLVYFIFAPLHNQNVSKHYTEVYKMLTD